MHGYIQPLMISEDLPRLMAGDLDWWLGDLKTPSFLLKPNQSKPPSRDVPFEW